ncbi:MAG: hypothetical protein K8J31_02645 [Anaerolineae bacterium]|nr:hypothetical protein [Anaerolineae bacterium]
MLENDWVYVNGARMRVAELEFLTHQLQLEYSRELDARRGVVNRLIGWLDQH